MSSPHGQQANKKKVPVYCVPTENWDVSVGNGWLTDDKSQLVRQRARIFHCPNNEGNHLPHFVQLLSYLMFNLAV